MSAEPPRRGLGRGLSALLGDSESEAPVAVSATPSLGLQRISIGSIRPNPTQPRRHFDDAGLDELAASIAERGVLQPIVVRPQGQNYEIVAGERRWRAAQRARLHDIPAIVRELNDSQMHELAIIENVQRQDLNVIEEAEAYQRLIRDFGHTQEALGKLVAKSRSHVANLLRLLDLPQEIRDLVANGALTMGHARALIGAPDPVALAREVIAKQLSVRDTEKLAKGAKPAPKGGFKPGVAATPAADADVASLERHLGDILGLKVKIEHGAKGGQIMVNYSTLDQLDLICQRLSGEPI